MPNNNDWIAPVFEEVPLNCEIVSYMSAELESDA